MNTIKHLDFLPAATARGGIFGGKDYSGFDECVAAMNHWLERNPVTVVQLETISLPNIYRPGEGGSTDTELHTSGYTVWYQLLRLWYTETSI